MRVLYAAYRHDPRDPDAGSGVDYFCYRSLVGAGFKVEICGPMRGRPALPERAFRRSYERLTGKRYAKFQVSQALRASSELNLWEREWRPDVVFTIFPATLVCYRGAAPCVYDQDLSFINWQRNYPEFGGLAQRINLWLERRAFSRCQRVITHSANAKQVLVDDYGIAADRIDVFPYPPTFGEHLKPPEIPSPDLPIRPPLHLLLVGRDRRRKGVDLAVQSVRMLDQQGVASFLTVVGLTETGDQVVRFAGSYKKNDAMQLRAYLTHYERSHLLLHPALFDPSPFVPSEAAAFGVPTITNDTGGLATTVADGVSGIVLPRHSPAEAYVEAILGLVRDPDRYRELRRTTRERYERELNWDVAGKRVAEIVRQVAEEGARSR